MPRTADRRRPSPRPRRRSATEIAPSELSHIRVDDPEVRASGIRRLRSGKGFRYVAADGAAVRDVATLERIRRLAIPPAYRDVWISSDPNTHLQAIGTDVAGRRQYRYHPDWHASRGETKFHRMLDFARALPRIRAAVARDLKLPGLPREKVLATIVALLERTMIRVGNEEYAKVHRHYGLTTLRAEHAEVERGRVRFSFTGKSGVEHDVLVKDPRLAKIVRRLEDVPGQELFHYLDAEGRAHRIGSGDVNAYIKEVAGASFTAKDFRTWSGTVLAARALGRACAARGGCASKKDAVAAVKEVARELRNTPAVARSGYIHPGVLAAAAEGALPRIPEEEPDAEETGLHADERAVLRLLRGRAQ